MEEQVAASANTWHVTQSEAGAEINLPGHVQDQFNSANCLLKVGTFPVRLEVISKIRTADGTDLLSVPEFCICF